MWVYFFVLVLHWNIPNILKSQFDASTLTLSWFMAQHLVSVMSSPVRRTVWEAARPRSSATWVGVITTVLWTAPMSQADRRRGLLHQQIIDDGSTRRRWWCYQVTLAGPLHVKIPLGGQFPSWSAPPVSARLNSMRRGGCKKWPRGEWPAEQQLRLFNNPSRGATYKTWPS